MILVSLLTGCRGETPAGPCIGWFTDKTPGLTYEMDTRNFVLALIFSETAFIPIIWAVKYAQCPIGEGT